MKPEDVTGCQLHPMLIGPRVDQTANHRVETWLSWKQRGYGISCLPHSGIIPAYLNGPAENNSV